MLRPKKNSYKEFDNEKIPITFLMVRPLPVIKRCKLYDLL